jgi:hypothetical protein
MSSGYEKSPDYGGLEPSGKESVLWIIVVAAIGVIIWRPKSGTF